MADNNPHLTAMKNTHREKVLDLLCNSSSRGESSVPYADILRVRNDTEASLASMNVDKKEVTRLMSLAEQEATGMYPGECQRRISASQNSSDIASDTKSQNEAIATVKQASTSNAPAPSATAPTKSEPVQLTLSEPTDELDFIASPHFSASNPLHNSLKNLDASYRCSICGDLYTTPVAVMPCLHTFCSECIRKHCKFMMGGMKRECRCPECNQFVSDLPP
jgi:hypothetical protein